MCHMCGEEARDGEREETRVVKSGVVGVRV